jgi:Cd2+/Zn2+-exporting ATPase
VLEKIRARGQIGVVVAWSKPAANPSAGSAEGQAAVLVLSDAIRPGAKDLVQRLHDLGIRPVRMLTGDNPVTAAHVAKLLGIDQIDAELLPEGKVRLLEELKHQTAARTGTKLRGVGVIGDGVNDAPALAAADVSIAIGSIGSDAALESADIVLLNDDLLVIPWAVRLARRTRAVVLFNIILALSIIGGMAAAVVIGSRTGWNVPLPIAVLAHEGGTLLVVLNSLRLLVSRKPDPAVGTLEEADTAPTPALVQAA